MGLLSRKDASKPKGSKGLEKLLGRLSKGDWNERMVAADALGELGDALAVQSLIDALDDDDKYLRRKVAKALGKLGDTRALQPLIEALTDKDYDVRWIAADALAELGDSNAIEPLEKGGFSSEARRLKDQTMQSR